MTHKLLTLLLALCLALSMTAAASAVTFTDAHGNVIELDSTLEAYTDYALDGANDAARKAETNLGDLWTDAMLWFAVSGRISEYYDEDDLAAGKFGAETLAAVLPYPKRDGGY